MAKGASIQFKSYDESVSKLLELLNLQAELKKYDKIVLKPYLGNPIEDSTSVEFMEPILKFCLDNKNPVTEVFIAEGADGHDTTELFRKLGYNRLAEKYGIGLIDLNDTETEEIMNEDFLKFTSINYPKILIGSFLISIPKLMENEETEISGSLANMLGAFPSGYYAGLFSSTKNKIRKWPIKYSIHDIIKCKSPDFAIVDASTRGAIFAGLPLEIDKQSAGALGKAWRDVSHIKLIEDSLSLEEEF